MNRGPNAWTSPLALLSLCLMLVACQVTIIPNPEPEEPFDGRTPTEVAFASGKPTSTDDAVLRDVALDAGDPLLLLISLDAAQAAANDLVYVMVDGDVLVTAYDVENNRERAVLASSDADWYGLPDDPDLATASAGVAPATIDVGRSVVCIGPCLARAAPSTAAEFYVEVVALSDTSADVYAFAETYTDTEEPNDSSFDAQLVTISAGFGETLGAIELLDDRDWYGSGSAVNRVLVSDVPASNPALDFQARVYDSSGAFLADVPLNTCFDPPDAGTEQLFVEVRVVNDRAAASSASDYRVEFHTGPGCTGP